MVNRSYDHFSCKDKSFSSPYRQLVTGIKHLSNSDEEQYISDNSGFLRFHKIVRSFARLPIVDEKALQLTIDLIWVLKPYTVLFVVARIRVVAADVHEFAVNAHDLRVRIQIVVFCVIAGPGPIEVNEIVNEAVDLVCIDASILVRENVHDDPETFLDLPDRGTILPSSVVPVEVVDCQDNADSLRILLKALTAWVRIGRTGTTHIGERICERYQQVYELYGQKENGVKSECGHIKWPNRSCPRAVPREVIPLKILNNAIVLVVIILQPIHQHLLTDDNAAGRRGNDLCPRRSTCPCRGVDS